MKQVEQHDEDLEVTTPTVSTSPTLNEEHQPEQHDEEHNLTIDTTGSSCRLSRRQRRIAMFLTVPLLGAGAGAATGVGVDAVVNASSAAFVASLTHSASEYAIEATLSTEAHIAIGIAIGFAVLLLAVGIGFAVTQHKKKQKALSMHHFHMDTLPKRSKSKSIFDDILVTAFDKSRLIKIKRTNPRGEEESEKKYHERLRGLFLKVKRRDQGRSVHPNSFWHSKI